MATATVMASQLRPTVSSLLPRLSPPTLVSSLKFTSIYVRQLSIPLVPALSIAVPSLHLGLPPIGSILGDIWDSVLRAVPKKHKTHSQSRMRQMAGKALKDVTSLCKCPACGRIKRMHYLCPFCTKRLLSMTKRDIGGSSSKEA